MRWGQAGHEDRRATRKARGTLERFKGLMCLDNLRFDVLCFAFEVRRGAWAGGK